MNTTPVKAYNGLSIDDLRQQLLEETDVTNIRDISRQLNAHLMKKDLIRKSELYRVQDKLQAQIEERVTNKANCFSNKDLIEYYRVIEDSISQLNNTEEIQSPTINIKPDINISLGDPELSRDEKVQVVDAVKAFITRMQNEQLEKNNNNVIEGDYKEING